MLTPVFTHGTYENTIKAIQEGKIRYPAYCWIVDRGQYGFINKTNELEIIGIPEFVGTLDNVIILSDFDDGIYQVKGQHKVTSDAYTTFDTASFIFVIVQTIDGEQKIRRITADEIYDYVVIDGEVAHETTQVTTDYLDANGYVTDEDVSRIIDESLVDYDDDTIRSLFDN